MFNSFWNVWSWINKKRCFLKKKKVKKLTKCSLPLYFELIIFKTIMQKQFQIFSWFPWLIGNHVYEQHKDVYFWKQFVYFCSNKIVEWSINKIRKKNFKIKNDFSLPYSLKSCFITKKKNKYWFLCCTN